MIFYLLINYKMSVSDRKSINCPAFSSPEPTILLARGRDRAGIGSSQTSTSCIPSRYTKYLPRRDSWCWPKVARPLGTRMTSQVKIRQHYARLACKLRLYHFSDSSFLVVTWSAYATFNTCSAVARTNIYIFLNQLFLLNESRFLRNETRFSINETSLSFKKRVTIAVVWYCVSFYNRDSF